MKMTETDLVNWIIEAFEYDNNIAVWRQNTGAHVYENKQGKKRFVRFGTAGAADITGIVKSFRCPKCNCRCEGVRLEIECKVGKGKQTNHQKEYQKNIEEFNGIYLLIYPEPNDPLYLRQRIEKIIYSLQCPKCSSNELE